MANDFAELAAVVGEDGVLRDSAVRRYLQDATESRGLAGQADAAVLPRTVEDVAQVVRWCYAHDVPLTPRGGGTGYAGGAVPNGGIVLSLERLRDVRSFEPLLWRAELEAGLTTDYVRGRARENGLLFPPDPGAAEQSQIGGNAATDAGGPHAFKYGTTGAWITGLEAVLAPGEVIRVGGNLRKDVAGYDLKSLLIGSEGTLGIITALNLRFIPAPEAALPVVACYAEEQAGCAAILACLGSGVVPATLEYLDAEATSILAASFPHSIPPDARFVVLAEADGSPDEARAARAELVEALAPAALAIHQPSDPREVAALWRWRDGVGVAADAVLGGKVSEDIVVPVDRLGDAIAGTREIAGRHGLRSCSWGHAGDGNLHSTFLLDRSDPDQLARAASAQEELFSLAIALGGSISGEHGVGVVKNGYLRQQWSARAVDLHSELKRLLDPKGLFNPGTKLA